MSKFGIENLKVVFTFVIGVVMTSAKQLKDGFQYTDLFALASSFTGIIEVIRIRLLAGAELADIDAEERAELVTWAKEKFDLDNDKAEAFVEEVIVWINQTVTVIKSAQNLKK